MPQDNHLWLKQKSYAAITLFEELYHRLFWLSIGSNPLNSSPKKPLGHSGEARFQSLEGSFIVLNSPLYARKGEKTSRETKGGWSGVIPGITTAVSGLHWRQINTAKQRIHLGSLHQNITFVQQTRCARSPHSFAGTFSQRRCPARAPMQGPTRARTRTSGQPRTLFETSAGQGVSVVRF